MGRQVSLETTALGAVSVTGWASRRRPKGELLFAGEVAVDFAGYVAFEATHDLFGAEAFIGTPLDVGAGSRVPCHANEHDPPEGAVGLAVTTTVEAIPADLA